MINAPKGVEEFGAFACAVQGLPDDLKCTAVVFARKYSGSPVRASATLSMAFAMPVGLCPILFQD
jgi:hypothetical protein